MKTVIKNSISTLFSVALAAVFLYLAFRGKDIEALWHSLIDVHWSWFVVLFAGSALSHLIRAWRWKYLLYPIKPDISIRNTFSVTMIGYLINNVIPRLGEFFRPYAMKKLEGVSRSATMGTIVLERILDLVTFALVTLIVLSIYAEPFAVWFPGMAEFEWLFFAAAGVMTVVFGLIFLKAEVLFQFLKKLMFLFPVNVRTQVERIFDSFLTGFQAAKHPGNFFMIALTSLLIWISYIVLLYIPFFIYDFRTVNALDFGAAAVVQVASGIAFALPTPSGIGSYHAFTSFTLTELYHVDPAQALSFAVYTHAVGFLTTTVLGLYYFFADKVHISDAMTRNDTEDPKPPVHESV
jgi:uncharacterized protein (TIRG00374 family)